VKSPKKRLTLKQERFCQLYARGTVDLYGNATRCYAEAYGVDLERGNYKRAQMAGSRLVSNDIISDRINKLLEIESLNDVFVDAQLAFVIRQAGDFGAKVAGIREYNKIRGRITEKIDHTTKGEKIAPILSRSTKDSE
jgi:hypothetical protein